MFLSVSAIHFVILTQKDIFSPETRLVEEREKLKNSDFGIILTHKL